MKPATSIAIFSVLTLVLSILLPLSAFAASGVPQKLFPSTKEIPITEEQKLRTDIKAEIKHQRQEALQERLDRREEINEAREKKLNEITHDRNERQSNHEAIRTELPNRVSPTKKPTVTPTTTEVKKITPTPQPSTKPQPTTNNTQQTEDTKQTYIMKAINEYRKSHGLQEVKTDRYTCAFAKVRAKEIMSSFNHDGFRDRIAKNTLPYPDYSQVTENIAMTSDYKKVVKLWINSPGHAENMRRDTPFVCVESSGNFYAYEGWRP